MATNTKKGEKVAEQAINSVNTAVDLSQKTANVVLDGTVKVAEMTDDYVQNAVKLGLDTQEAGMNIASSYFNAMAKVNREWIKFFSSNGERMIDTVGDMTKKQVDGIVESGVEIVENASQQVKQAAK